MFLQFLLLASILQFCSVWCVTNDATLSEFAYQLDATGMELMNKMYSRERQQRDINERNSNDLIDEPHTRVRRSGVVMDLVKAAQKTGNREELDLRSSFPLSRVDYFNNADDIVTIDIQMTNETSKFFIVSHKIKNGSFDSAVTILRLNSTTGRPEVYQILPETAPYKLAITKARVDQNIFTHFLAVSRAGSSVAIYKMATSSPQFFFKVQDLHNVPNVETIKFIDILQQTYLVVGTYLKTLNGRQFFDAPDHIRLFEYHQPSQIFFFHASLPASGVVDVEAFTVRRETYLITANHNDNDGNLGIFSYVYRYDITQRRFKILQHLPTNGARDVEHFILANENYIVVANEARGTLEEKIFDAQSDIYKLEHDKFVLIQTVETYGALQWRYLAVPNCKQDVLLIYADQRNDMDQVGVYSFSHELESFKIVQFSLFHMDEVNSTYRPLPKSLATYSTQDYESGEYNLYVVMGTENIAEGSNLYQLSYDIVLADSPLDSFTRDVQDKLSNLNDTLNDVKNLLKQAKNTLEDAVKKDEQQIITGKKNYVQLETTEIKIQTLNLTTGSILYLKDNQTYRADPTQVSNVNITQLEANSTRHSNVLSNITNEEDNFMLLNEVQNVTGDMVFESITASSNIDVHGNITSLSGVVNGINVEDLSKDLVIDTNNNTVVTGKKSFKQSTIFENMVSFLGPVNGLNLSTDIFLNNTHQRITGRKIFKANTSCQQHLQTGKINNISIPNDLLFTNINGNINGIKTFTADLTINNATVTDINGVTLESVLNNRVVKSGWQYVTGAKIIARDVTSDGNVQINDLVNGIDIEELAGLVGKSENQTIIIGDKTFEGDVTIYTNLTVDDSLNNIKFPADVVLKNVHQNISATKTFENVVNFQKDVTLHGVLDNINTSTFVTLDEEQNITGHIEFNETVYFSGDINVSDGTTINDIDISTFSSSLLTISTNQTINHLSFQQADLDKPNLISVNGDNISTLSELYDDSLHINDYQNITGLLNFTNELVIRNNLNADTINGFHFPDDFARISGNQTFTAPKVFHNTVVLTEVSQVDSINGVPIADLLENVIYRDGNTTTTGHKTFTNNVTINGNLLVNKLNGISTDDLMFLTTDQNITGYKYFNNITIEHPHILRNLTVETTIDGVDLSELDLSGMTVSKNETITGDMCFEQIDYNTSTEYINGIDLSKLRDDIVTVNNNQEITSNKIFDQLIIDGNLNTTSTIDGIDVSDLHENTVYQNQPSVINATISFSENVTINGNFTTQILDGVNMSSFHNLFLSKSTNETLKSLNIQGDVEFHNITTQLVNGLNVSTDIVYNNQNQTIHGKKVFSNITANTLISDLINDKNLSEFSQEVVYKNQNQTLHGNKYFSNNVLINGDLTTNGLINGLDLNDLQVVRTESSNHQNVTGHKTFVENVSIKKLQTKLVHGQNISSLFENAARIDRDETIDGSITFEKDITVDQQAYIKGDLDVEGLVNDVNVTSFNENVFKTTGTQNIGTKTFTADVHIENVLAGSVNNVAMDTLLTKATQQTINGSKTFESLYFNDDVQVGLLTNTVNVSSWLDNTLMKNMSQKQTVTGSKIFNHNVTFTTIQSSGTVDGLDIQHDEFVTLNTTQMINGTKVFSKDLKCYQLDVLGTLVDTNLTELNNTRVLLSTDQTITSDLTFLDNVIVEKNVSITGLVNGIDLSNFNLVAPDLSENVEQLQNEVETTVARQCDALMYVKGSLQESSSRLDYFTHAQELALTTKHTEFFTIDNSSYLALSVNDLSENTCVHSSILKWNGTSFIDYQTIPTASVSQMEFITSPWSDSYLLILNNNDACSFGENSTQLMKWDATTSQFIPYLHLQVKATQAEYFNENNTTFIYITNKNQATHMWQLTEDGSYLQSTNDLSITSHISQIVSPSTSYLFKAERYSSDTSRGPVFMYSLNNNGTKNQLTEISSRGASSITSFKANDITYLVVANDHDYTTNGHSTYDVSIEIYTVANQTIKWFQSLPAHQVTDVTTRTIGTTTYLAAVHYLQGVSLYKFQFDLGFKKIDYLLWPGVEHVNFFQTGEFDYVSVSKKSSEILQINPIGPNTAGLDNDVSCLI